jgi:molybdopterin/thiamine biosynthesis adenylyltransferase/molybdopterin synthase catalytic subunit/rhodanese-related sulfurtransferase
MFTLTEKPIDVELLKKELANPSAGGFASFEGWVRNYHEGNAVTSLEYEAYNELAEKEAELIISETKDKCDILDAHCTHRIGHLEIGELAVWIGVTAVHRDAAFKACRYIIDEIKSRLPIWKKEYYADGSAEWVNCKASAEHTHEICREEELYYSRQTLLPEVGSGGQKKLKNSKVLIVGAGGLGCPALQYLGAAGIGAIGICDFDKLDISNIHRQTFYQIKDIGKPKVELAAKFISNINPFIKVNQHNEILSQNNIGLIFNEYDLILDCTDNFETKFLISDTAVKLKKPVIFASIYQFEGQIWSYLPEQNSPCIRCIWEDIPQPGCIGSCAEVGVLGAIPGILGTMQATIALKFLLGISTELSESSLTLVDLNNLTTRKIKCIRNPQCLVCRNLSSKTKSLEQPIETDNRNLEIDIEKLINLSPDEFEMIDVRTKLERERQDTLPYFSHHIPITTDYNILLEKLSTDKTYVIVCQHGIRSRYAANLLNEHGYENVYTLTGGISLLSKTVVEN